GALLCGERDGRIVPGFDLGNSPSEYDAARVDGKTLIFASTNGSQALRWAGKARLRIPGAFVNAGAVAKRATAARTVWIVAAGKLGRFALEDAACAGWMARALVAQGFRAADAAARTAIAMAPADAGGVTALLQGCAHGRYLR